MDYIIDSSKTGIVIRPTVTGDIETITAPSKSSYFIFFDKKEVYRFHCSVFLSNEDPVIESTTFELIARIDQHPGIDDRIVTCVFPVTTDKTGMKLELEFTESVWEATKIGFILESNAATTFKVTDCVVHISEL